ncbi:glycosyltransferase family 1 protein [Cyclobacteriaceae bacterium YHN15]|nr:glycosyltransferase family 1 protein [Cyclobacteriaceae bacterium YHN15]
MDKKLKINNKKLLVIFEFGIPPYRTFLLEYFYNLFNKVKFIHNEERFGNFTVAGAAKSPNFKIFKEISFTYVNIFDILKSDVIVTTFNIRKIHTWIFCFFFPNKKWIFWGKGLGQSNNFVVRFLRKILLKISKGFVVYTKEGKDKLIALGYPSSKVSIAYNTLKIDNCELTNDEPKYFLYVGRLQKRKELEKLLYELQFIDTKFLIVGNGDLKDELLSLVNKYKIENKVDFLPGVFEEDELKKLFNKAIAYISPGAVGLGVVHSFAYGVPVITSILNKNHGPEFSYLNDSNSFLYENDLSSQMKLALSDEKTRQAKKKEAFRFYSENLSYQNVINAFEYQFNKLLNETDHTRP